MSLPEQESVAVRRAWEFLLCLSSGEIRIAGHIKEVRQEARDIVKHFPPGGDLRSAAEKQLGERKPIPDNLNIP